MKTNKGSACKRYKGLLQINKKMVNPQNKKRTKYMSRHFTKGEIWKSNKYKMRFITSINLTSDQRKIILLKHHFKIHQNGKKSPGSSDENVERVKWWATLRSNLAVLSELRTVFTLGLNNALLDISQQMWRWPRPLGLEATEGHRSQKTGHVS